MRADTMALPTNAALPDLSIAIDVRDLRLEPQQCDECISHASIRWTLDPRKDTVAACLRCEDVNNILEKFKLAEEQRGNCRLFKHKQTTGKQTTLNRTYLCNAGASRTKAVKAKQSAGLLGAQAAKMAAKASQTATNRGLPRVGKNSRGTGVTCCQCKYKMHCRVFHNHPNDLYIVLHNQGKHSSGPAQEGCPHQPVKVSDAARGSSTGKIADRFPRLANLSGQPPPEPDGLVPQLLPTSQTMHSVSGHTAPETDVGVVGRAGVLGEKRTRHELEQEDVAELQSWFHDLLHTCSRPDFPPDVRTKVHGCIRATCDEISQIIDSYHASTSVAGGSCTQSHVPGAPRHKRFCRAVKNGGDGAADHTQHAGAAAADTSVQHPCLVTELVKDQQGGDSRHTGEGQKC